MSTLAPDAVCFTVPKAERKDFRSVLKRARQLFRARKVPVDMTTLEMDLAATHNHICRLDFARRAAADDFNFLHDLFGITDCIDRELVAFVNHFLPRFRQRSAPKAVAA